MSSARSRVSNSEESTVSQGSSSAPTFAELKACASRLPQAIVKCSVIDVLTMPHVDYQAAAWRSIKAELFMLKCYPCYYVELIGWVAGVDFKSDQGEMQILLDDGNGQHVVQVKIRVPLAPNKLRVDQRARVEPELEVPLNYFPDSKRKDRNAKPTQPITVTKLKEYIWPDIRVGNTLKIIGVIEQFAFRSGETLRFVSCDLRGGTGTVTQTDLKGQIQHAKQVAKLHRDVYSLPFDISSASLSASPSTQQRTAVNESFDPNNTINTLTSSLGTSDMLYSQAANVPKLRAPERLHRRMLTDETFLRYLADYMISTMLLTLDDAGPSRHHLIGQWLPEYAKAILHESNSQIRPSSALDAPPFTIPHLEQVPQLKTLAALVVNAEVDRRVKVKIRDDPKLSAKTSTGSALRKALRKESELSIPNVEKRARKLLMWALRRMAEEGTIVQVQSQSQTTTEAYLPLPTELISPILLCLLEIERKYRNSFFIRPSDPRKSNGVTVVDLLGRLRSWGDEGRWERLPEWVVEDGIEDLDRAGRVRKWGSGWWPVE